MVTFYHITLSKAGKLEKQNLKSVTLIHVAWSKAGKLEKQNLKIVTFYCFDIIIVTDVCN